MFNTRVTSAGGCYVYYLPSSNTLFLENDGGTGTLTPTVTPGTSQQVSNSQCILKGSGSSVSQSGNNLSLSVALTFSGTFTGQKNVYLFALGKTNLNSGWIQKGTWTP